MIVFPNCKINLGLRIIRKRTDGYHDLETIFYPVRIHDALEVISNSPSQQSFSLTITGLEVGIPEQENICVKAYQLLKKDFDLPPVKIHLHKVIPTGAGLGGGSANGAFMLKLLNEKCDLQLNQQQLFSYALKLGSDCPFFIVNQPCYATGRGEKLQPVNLNLSAFKIIVVLPNIHIPTALAFSKLKPVERIETLGTILETPVNEWRDLIYNDFEEPIFLQYPEIKEIKEKLYQSGATYASMTGSGSAVFGLFDKDLLPDLKFPSQYFVRVT